MARVFKHMGAWLAAVLATVFLGVTLQTQNLISRLGAIGADVGLGERFSMTAYDIAHLGSLYGLFIAIALAIAFLASGFLYRFTKFGRPVIYAVAGGTAILIMLFLMKRVFFDVHIIAGARDGLGIGLQVLAGGVGGFIYAIITQKQNREYLIEDNSVKDMTES